MIKLSKKIFILFLVSVFCVNFIGCNKNMENQKLEVIKGIPDYSEYEQTLSMPIGAWLGPEPTLDNYRLVKEAGIDFLNAADSFGALDFATCVRAAEQAGIKVMPTLHGRDYKTCVGEEYSSPAFMTFNFYDEPAIDKYEWFAEQKAEFEVDYPDKIFYVNLNPMYVAESVIKSEYVEHVRLYLDTVKPSMVSYDFYPLLSISGYSKLHEKFLRNIEIFAELTSERNVDFWAFMQTMSYTSDFDRRLPTEADLRFQAYCYMAYGVKALQHFCYQTPPVGTEFRATDYAMIDRNNQPTPIYGYAKNVNLEIKKFDHVYLSFNWFGNMTTRGSNSTKANDNFINLKNALNSHERISSITSSEDLLSGFFKDEQGYDGFMFVNFTDPSQNKTNDISVEFREADKVIEYVKGEATVKELENGKYTYSLAAGEGIFVIPVKM